MGTRKAGAIDITKAAMDLGLEEGEYLELMRLFVVASASDLNRLRFGMERGDAHQAASAAHSVKGAAEGLGLRAIHELAEHIEKMARDKRLEGLTESVQALERELDSISLNGTRT